MNAKDMIIQSNELGFRVAYLCSSIISADIHYNLGAVMFRYSDDRTITIDVSNHVELSAYNLQFGVTLTDDGTKFFLQSWEMGLFCFETQTGTLLWHIKRKKAFQLATRGNTVLCHFSGQCIAIIDVASGDILRNYSFTSGTTFKPLSSDYYLVGPKRNRYEIIDGDLETVSKIPVSKLNPHAFDCFIIQDASLDGGNLVIAGVEYLADEFQIAVKTRHSNMFLEKSRFLREIPVAF